MFDGVLNRYLTFWEYYFLVNFLQIVIRFLFFPFVKAILIIFFKGSKLTKGNNSNIKIIYDFVESIIITGNNKSNFSQSFPRYKLLRREIIKLITLILHGANLIASSFGEFTSRHILVKSNVSGTRKLLFIIIFTFPYFSFCLQLLKISQSAAKKRITNYITLIGCNECYRYKIKWNNNSKGKTSV